VAALAGLDPTDGRAVFVETALGAASEEDAHRYQRTAELLRAYHERVAPLVDVAGSGQRMVGTTRDGHRVVPLVADHVVWTRSVQALAKSLAAHAAGGAPDTELLVTGTLSPRARRELESLGLAVSERAFVRRAAPAGAKADAGRGDGPTSAEP